MALSDLRKSNSNSSPDLDKFISGAAKRVSELKPSQQKYKRLTFSLDEQTDQQIDVLLVKSQLARANRSIIIRAAIQQLATLSADELQRIVTLQIDS